MNNKIRKYISVILLLALLITSFTLSPIKVYAASVDFGGFVTTGNTFYMPDISGYDENQQLSNAYSGIGQGPDAHYFFSSKITPSATGSYTLEVISAKLTPNQYSEDDTILFLYDSTFNPSSPMNGWLYANDNMEYGINKSKLTVTLTAGVTYVIVVTGYTRNATGSVNLSASGAGTLAVVGDMATISGNAGVAGATLSYYDSGAKTATADASGLYSFSVTSGWSGTVTPSKSGYTFTPSTKSYSNVTANQASQNYNANAANTAPIFVGATTTLSVNQNAPATDIKDLLHASDSDSGQTLTWSKNTAPSHGTLNFSSATASSGGANITPGGTITYTPTAGYAGSDSFIVMVSDGTATAYRTIIVTVNDVTAPTITAGTVTRTSDTAGTVKFTSSEAGQYYYAIVNQGAGAPAINTSSAGTACTAGESTITNPTGLTAGAKDIYIKIKDAANNVSTVLLINIPAYVPPGKTLTADTVNNDVDHDIDITFETDAAFAGAIAGVSFNGQALTSNQYTVDTENNNKITLHPSSADNTYLRTPATGNVVITATGYGNSSVSQTITAGTAASLVVSTQPVPGAASGTLFATQPVVTLKDKYNNTCTNGPSATANVTAASQAGTGAWTIGGTATKAAVAGVATFTDLTCALTAPGNGEVTFTSGTLTADSNSFAIPNKSGKTLTADTTSNEVDNDIEVTFAADASFEAAITGVSFNGHVLTSNQYTVSSGVVTLKPSSADNTYLRTPAAGNVVITATGYSNSSVSQTITAGTAASLVVSTQPVPGAASGTLFATQPVVTLKDKYNNICTNGPSATANVTATSQAGTGTWTIGGTATKAAVAGVVTYTDLTCTLSSYGNGAVSFTSGAATVDSNTFTVPPSIPGTSVIQSANGGDSHVMLVWNGVQGAAGYKIYRSVTSGVYGSPIYTAGSSDTSYDVTGLTNGTTYYFVIKATNAAGDSIASNEVTVTPQVAAPGAPVVQAASAGDAHVNITWNSVSGATEYKVYTSTASGIYTTPAATVAGSVYSYDATGLTNGTTYYFVVKASNPGGDSANSNELSATPQVPAPGAPTGLTAIGGNIKVTLNWSSVSGATGYKIFQSTTSGSFSTELETVTGSVYSYEATGLTNGTTYYFVIKAVNPGGDSPSSSEVSAMPLTIPGAPTNVSATAGNGQATITFTAPADNGGTPITSYVVTSSPGSISATATGTAITVTGLTNGTSYKFTVKAVNAVGDGADSAASNAVTPYIPSSGGNSGGSLAPTLPTETGVDVLVNGKAENAGMAKTTKEGGKTVTTITVDQTKLDKKLASEGNNAVVTIPVNTQADVVIGQLNGQMVKNMEAKAAVLQVKTENATYSLPAQQINIDAISAQLGQNAELKDIKVQVEIAKSPAATVEVVESSARKGEFAVVAPPMDFTVTISTGGNVTEISNFNVYVERTVLIPNGIDPNKITTGIVVESDGTTRHVPTRVTAADGRYYAVINSLTNSTYSVVWHPLEFKDVANHWAKAAINDMGSRMVVSGVGNDQYEPERDITRAEFAAIVVKALGLKPGIGNNQFSDVNSSAWYCEYIKTATEYGIIAGYGNGKFGPMDKITREQAMTMVAKAMKITGLKNGLSEGDINKLLAEFGDSSQVAAYAKEGIAACVNTGIVSGKTGEKLAPKDEITRAEVAVIIRKLLQKSNLI